MSVRPGWLTQPDPLQQANKPKEKRRKEKKEALSFLSPSILDMAISLVKCLKVGLLSEYVIIYYEPCEE